MGAALQHTLWIAAGWGGLIFVLVLGLKNNSITAHFFINADGSPSVIAQIVVVGASLCTALVTCLGGTPGGPEPTAPVVLTGFLGCLVAAVVTMLSATGAHLALNVMGGTTTKVVLKAMAVKNVKVSTDMKAGAN